MFGLSVFIIMFHCYNQSQEKEFQGSIQSHGQPHIGLYICMYTRQHDWLYRQTHVRQNLDTILGGRNHVLDLGHI